MTIEPHSSDGRPAAGGPDWSLGRYEPTAEQLVSAAALAVERAAATIGEAVLDVGCGSGNAAILAAARGAKVIGVDPAPRLLEVARDRAAAKRYEIEFLQGFAEALPVSDASVDLLLSVFGVIFTTDPHRAAAEFIRVTANPGRIVLTAWLPGGALSEVAKVSRSAVFSALGQEPTPLFAWHDRETLIDLFGPHGFSVELDEATLVHRARSLDEYMTDVVDVHPLAVAGHALLEPTGEAESLRAETRAILAKANEDPDRFAVSSRYAIVVARRSDGSPPEHPTGQSIQ